MTLDSILKEFPNIRLANKADNKAILEFYSNSQLKSAKQDVIYTRGDDFFKFMDEKSKDYLVFLLIDDAGVINGIASINYRKGYIDGELQTIGYLGDLRINLNRKLIRQWRKMYSLFIEHSSTCPQRFYCKYYQTALMEENLYSRNNLANNKIKNVHYEPIEKYKMINIIGRVFPRKHQFKVERLTLENKDEIFNLILNDHVTRQFGIDALDELTYRLKNWEEFNIQDFYFIRDEKGELISATYLWAPQSSKQILIGKIPRGLKFIGKMISMFPFVRIGKSPSDNKPLKIQYIHQLSFREDLSEEMKKECFHTFVDHFLDLRLDINMLAYCDFENESYSDVLKGYLLDKQLMGLYSVHHKKDGTIYYPLVKYKKMPAFDMSLV